jgi:hypothetical protein
MIERDRSRTPHVSACGCAPPPGLQPWRACRAAGGRASPAPRARSTPGRACQGGQGRRVLPEASAASRSAATEQAPGWAPGCPSSRPLRNRLPRRRKRTFARSATPLPSPLAMGAPQTRTWTPSRKDSVHLARASNGQVGRELASSRATVVASSDRP